MDLLKGPIRDGSRGGRNEFKWADVKDSKDREYYLGVSVKAPTGRWQQNRDIQWYSRDNNSSADEAALEREKARAEEIRKIKEAENDALSAALGFKVARRRTDAEELSQGEVDRAIKEAGEGGDEREDQGNEKGIGFGRTGVPVFGGGEREVMAGHDKDEDTVRWRSVKADRSDHRDKRDGRRDDRGRKERHDKSARHRDRDHRSRSRNRDKDRHRISESKDRERRHERRRDRSRSPRANPSRSHRDRDRDRGERRDYDKRDRSRDRYERRHRSD